jgi:hypothetical protein
MDAPAPQRSRFATALKQYRLKQSLRQGDVDIAAGIAVTTTAKLENDAFAKVASREMCSRLEHALKLEADTLWEIAVLDRLRQLDADVYAWVAPRLTGGPAAPERVTEALAELEESVGVEPGEVANVVVDIAMLLTVDIETEEAASEQPAKHVVADALQAMRRFEELPSAAQLHLLRSFASGVNAAIASIPTPSSARSRRRR